MLNSIILMFWVGGWYRISKFMDIGSDYLYRVKFCDNMNPLYVANFSSKFYL